ncbi:MAG: InlB B-repeat-containing protein [Treponema sp.]|nr:InlB B-repeat-containing protein [Treponema sp.]
MKTKKVLSVLFASLFLAAAGLVSCSQEAGVSPVPSNRVTYCSIEFEGNGGTLSFTSTQVAIGQYLTEFPTAYKDGYELKGWYYNNNGVETKFDENTVVTDSLKVYAKWIIPYTPGVSVQTISLDNPVVTVESGTTFELTATYTPADAEVSPSYANYYNYLYYPVGSITAAGGTMSKRFYAKLPGSYTSTYLYDGYTGKSTGYANVTVTGPALDAIPELPVSGSKAETASEYTHYTFSEDNYVTFYKLELTAGVTYAIQTSGNSRYNRLYDSSYNSCYSATSSTTTTYTPSVSGTYILGICSYYLSGGTVGVNVYSPGLIQTFALNPSSYTVESGETFEIIANYSPADAEVSPTYGNYSYSRYYPVGNLTAADGVMSESFYAKLPGTYSSTYLKDNMSGKQTAYASVTVTGPALSDVATLSINSTKAENAEDFTKYTFSADNYVKFYKVNLSAGTTYNFQVAHNSNIISGSPYCYWALYNSSYSIIYGESSSSSYAYTPASDGTYILGICSYYNNSGTIGVNVYNVQPITDFTVSSTVNMTIGDTISENIVTTPTTGCETNFTVSSGNNDLFAKFVNNQVVFTCGFPGTKTITVRDNISGIQKTIAVNVAGDSSVVQEIDTVYDGASSNPDEYTKVNLSDTNPSQLLKVYFEAGKTYSVQCADSDNSQGTGLSVSDCYFYLYDTSFAQIRSTDSGTISYLCTTPGYYYVGIRRYSNNGNKLGAVHIFAPKVIESLVLNPATYTVESGETFAITADYTPVDAEVSAGYSNYTNSRYYPVGNMTAANGVMSKSFYAKLPGTYTSTNLYDNTSGKSTASASVTVTGPAAAGLDTLTVRSARAEEASDYTLYGFSDNNYVKFYKIGLEAGTKYNFQIAHNGNVISGSPYCYWALYDSSYVRVLEETDNSSRAYTPASDGIYILGICPNYNDSGTIGVNVYNVQPITDFTVSSTVNMTIGDTVSENIVTTPATGCETDFTVSSGNSELFAKLVNNQVVFTCGFPGTKTITVKDNFSGIQKTITVNVAGDSSVVSETLTVGSGSSSTASDYTQVNLSDTNPSQLFKVYFEAGKTYHIQCADSDNSQGTGLSLNDCYFYLFNPSFAFINQWDSGIKNYACSSSGYYYVGIRRFSNYNNRTGAVYVYTTD